MGEQEALYEEKTRKTERQTGESVSCHVHLCRSETNDVKDCCGHSWTACQWSVLVQVYWRPSIGSEDGLLPLCFNIFGFSSFWFQNVYIFTETSLVQWKFELRNAWGQQRRVSTLKRCFMCRSKLVSLLTDHTSLHYDVYIYIWWYCITIHHDRSDEAQYQVIQVVDRTALWSSMECWLQTQNLCTGSYSGLYTPDPKRRHVCNTW